MNAKIVCPLNRSRGNLTWWWSQRNDVAIGYWVSSISWRTLTGRRMIDYKAIGVYATRSRTWVQTFFVTARSTFRTVAIRHTFWSTFNIWITVVLRQASTRAGIILFATNGICSARAGRARISLFLDYWNAINGRREFRNYSYDR